MACYFHNINALLHQYNMQADHCFKAHCLCWADIDYLSSLVTCRVAPRITSHRTTLKKKKPTMKAELKSEPSICGLRRIFILQWITHHFQVFCLLVPIKIKCWLSFIGIAKQLIFFPFLFVRYYVIIVLKLKLFLQCLWSTKLLKVIFLQDPAFTALLTNQPQIQREIVNKHNELRRSVNPTASNMLKMVRDCVGNDVNQLWSKNPVVQGRGGDPGVRGQLWGWGRIHLCEEELSWGGAVLDVEKGEAGDGLTLWFKIFPAAVRTRLQQLSNWGGAIESVN